MNQRLSGDLLDQLTARLSLTANVHERLPIHAPWTGECIYNLILGEKSDVVEAEHTARKAQRKWSGIPIQSRVEVFKRFHDLLLKHQSEVLDIIQTENGKSRKHAYEEVADIANVTRYYAYHGPRILHWQKRKGVYPVLTSARVVYHPLGVVGIIAPWNFPLSMAMTDAIPALIAGNSVLLKPAEQTTLTALWAARLLDQAGLPKNVFQVISGHGEKAGAAIVDHVDAITFTGSTRTGRKVSSRAGKHLIPATMELGGKNSMIVVSDANLSAAVDGAVRGCFASGGQLCISLERILVHASLYNEFVQRFRQRIQELRIGPGYSWDIDMGCLISDEHLKKVNTHVKDAVKKGAKVIVGGKRRPDLGPLFFEPTVLANVTPKMKLYAEETFGPVVSISSFRSLQEAIEIANDTEYGLNASIWSTDIPFARRLALRIKAGTVNINEAYAAAWASVDTPMGGMKASGTGRRHGPEGILKYTEPQTIAVQSLLPVGNPKGVGAKLFASIFTIALKVLKAVPFLR